MTVTFNDPKYYPHYQKLNTVEKSMYKQAFFGICEGLKEVKIENGGTLEEITKVYRAIYYDHSELFWYEGCGWTYRVNDKVIKIEPKYNKYVDNRDFYKGLIEKEKKFFLEGVVGKKVYEAERMIHDRMANSITYAHGENDQNILGALVEKKVVCGGYSRAFQYLMFCIGVPCFYVVGKTKKEGDSFHAWNILKLGNDYYNLDMTWDDVNNTPGSKGISYKYYNCTDKYIEMDHWRSDDFKFLPACNATKYSFENCFGISIELESIYQKGVTTRKIVSNKQDYFEVLKPVYKITKKVIMFYPLLPTICRYAQIFISGKMNMKEPIK